MKSITLLKAINDIQEEYIEAAAPIQTLHKPKYSFSWLNMKFLVGVFAILIIAIFVGNNFFNNSQVLEVTPYVDCETMKDAEKIVGYSLITEDNYLNSLSNEISVYNESLLEVTYYDDNNQAILTIRKEKSSNIDISGDYNEYDISQTIHINDFDALLEGNNNLYQKATWINGAYSYSLALSNGIELESIIKIIETIK